VVNQHGQQVASGYATALVDGLAGEAPGGTSSAQSPRNLGRRCLARRERTGRNRRCTG
jgi:hypothetical protein